MTESFDRNELIGQSIANNKYVLTEYIDSGSFSYIFKVKERNSSNNLVVKLESFETNSPQLGHEFAIYQLLRYQCSHQSIPKTYFFGEFLTYKALILEELGPNIATVFNNCNKKFTVKTITLLAIQMMKIFEYVHSRRVIYRDVKPENLLLGLSNTSAKNILHLIDFGLAKEYIDINGEHIPYKEGVGMNGTARYMSINTHLYQEQSRRDDMEAIGYLLIYLLRGHLPWSGLNIDETIDRFAKIGEIKQNTSLETLCDGFPHEFCLYLQTVRSLNFTEEPNYKSLIAMFEQLLTKMGVTNDNMYDWNDPTIKNEILNKSSKNISKSVSKITLKDQNN
ncbi:casein kinase I-like [Oppia nitens]|uniref:casein kinase I-like n=1 Tax=Oppia nitens TaxID=1686743 RepID=UPI0023DCC475|nr:casein kinase I-like [Oppia nitens]